MKIPDFPFTVTDWARMPVSEHPGITGMALWRTLAIGDLRVRMVEYSPGYSESVSTSSHHALADAGEDMDGETTLREIAEWAMPWLGYALLAAAAVFGLVTASGAEDAATYDAGFITFGLAVAIIALRLKQSFDGQVNGILLPVLADDGDTLLMIIAVLAVLGIGGLFLAADIERGVLHAIGFALFAIAVLLIFFNIKHYFDRRDRRIGG